MHGRRRLNSKSAGISGPTRTERRRSSFKCWIRLVPRVSLQQLEASHTCTSSQHWVNTGGISSGDRLIKDCVNTLGDNMNNRCFASVLQSSVADLRCVAFVYLTWESISSVQLNVVSEAP